MKFLALTFLVLSGMMTFGQTPTLNCNNNILTVNDPGVCSANVTYTPPPCASNCAGTTIYQSDGTGFTSGSDFPVGTTFIEYTITNGIDSSVCIFKVEVFDTENPNIVCGGNINESFDNNCQFIVPEYRTPTHIISSSDNCGIDTIYQVPNPGTVITGAGTYPITFTAEDAAGNTADCSFNVTIADNTPPVVSCPGNQIEPASGTCTATLQNYVALTSVTDNCDANPVMSQSPAPGTSFTNSETVTIYAQDASGNIDSCSFMVTTDDNIAPTVTCPNDTLIYLDGACEYLVADFTPFVLTSDNCDPSVNLNQTPAVGTKFSGHGTNFFVTMEASDDAGNSSVCSFNVVLQDSIAPTFASCQDTTIYLNGFCEYNLDDFTAVVGGSDNCGAITYNQSPLANTLINSNTTTPLAITIQDVAGNIGTCNLNIITIDTISPVITSCANDSTVSTGTNNCDYVLDDWTSLITANDACGTVSVTQSIAPGSILPSGDTTLTFTVSDINGNSSSCSITVSVEDLVQPSIVCPLNPNEVADATCGFTLPSYDTIATISDNCGTISVFNQTPLPGTVINGIGSTQNITLYVEDAFGNSNSCGFTITVVDETAPDVVCPDTQYVDIDVNCQFQVPDIENLVTFSDFCDANPSYSQSPLPGVTVTNPVDITVSVSDMYGNVNQCTTVAMPNDTVSPTIVCPSDIAQCNPIVTFNDAVGNDNCGLPAVELNNAHGLSSGSTFPEGVTAVTFEAKDLSGNTATCTFNVEVYPSPQITIPSIDSIAEGEYALIDATITNDSTIFWTPNLQIDDQEIETPTVSPPFSTWYTVTVLSSSGCTSVDSVFVPVDEIEEIVINNFLSPNGDGKNDTWNVNKPVLIQGCFVRIYDRWGKNVYSSNAYNNEWNGTNDSGVALPDGTYYYSISCSGESDIKGTILLMR